MNLSNTKQLLKVYNLKPNKLLGQNFLVCEDALTKIIDAAKLTPEDVILEIGPGLGVLTIELAKHAKKVIAIEKDKEMIKILQEILTSQNITNVELINDDILTARNVEISKYKIIANLPYYITNPIIMKFLEAENHPELMVFMVQKEVAQRICASPRRSSKSEGGPKMNKLAVFCQFYSQPQIISYVPKSCFWPSPKVDSAIIKLTPTFGSPTSKNWKTTFSKVVNAGFSQPRKQLINNLSKALNLSRKQITQWLASNSIKPTQRAESLSVEKWINLTETFNSL